MSWTPDGTDTGNSQPFARFKCKVCSRTMITNGSPPQTPCVCSPGPRPKHRNMKGLRR